MSGIVATANASASTYVTKGDLAGMIASKGGRKWDRSPSPEPPPALEQDWAEDVEEVAVNDREEGQVTDFTSEESGSEEPFSASQSQRLLSQSLTEMVQSGFKLPPVEVPEVSFSSLGLHRVCRLFPCIRC